MLAHFLLFYDSYAILMITDFFIKDVMVLGKIRSYNIEGIGKAVSVITEEQIIALLNRRDETALRQIRRQYGGICLKTAMQIIHNKQDAEEILNDALLRIWNAIPPEQPDDFTAYLCTVVRRLALNRQAQSRTAKRGSGIAPLCADAAEQIPAPSRVEQLVEEQLMLAALQKFLDTLSAETRIIFVQRYGAQRTIPEIARMYRLTESKVGVTLMRTRKKLRQYLKEEGWL